MFTFTQKNKVRVNFTRSAQQELTSYPVILILRIIGVNLRHFEGKKGS